MYLFQVLRLERKKKLHKCIVSLLCYGCVAIKLLQYQAELITYEEKVKVKVNFTLEQARKAQRWSRSIALFFLQLRLWMGVGV